MIEADRLVSAGTIQPDDVVDRAIRPKLLDEYIGQPQVRSQMEIFIQAAKLRGDALMTCCLSTRSTVFLRWWRKCSIRQWRITSWIS